MRFYEGNSEYCPKVNFDYGAMKRGNILYNKAAL